MPRRILFLVDRNNLGRQTLKEFQTYRPPGTGRLFTELYNVQRLGAAGLDPPAKVVISTIQRVFAQLTGTELSEEDEEASDFEGGWTPPPKQVAYSATMPPETFDIVVVDECHRSIYGKWRAVLEASQTGSTGPLLRFREEASARGDSESLREADFHILKIAFDPRDLVEQGDEDARQGGRAPRLTVMEEVLLLGLKDKQVRVSVFCFSLFSSCHSMS